MRTSQPRSTRSHTSSATHASRNVPVCKPVAQPVPWASAAAGCMASDAAALSRADEQHATRAAARDVTLEQSTRRGVLTSLAVASIAVLFPAPAAHSAEADAPQILLVGPGQRFTTIGDALSAAAPGATIRVAPGVYRERLRVVQPVTLEPAVQGPKGGPAGTDVLVEWTTDKPYQSVMEVEVPEGQVVIRGLKFNHYSKSVANNYGVYLKAGTPRLEGCDVTSTSGSGICMEACNPTLVECVVHDCARHGVAIFGSAEDPLAPAGGAVQGCDIRNNALDGVLVRGGASPDLLDNMIRDNGGWGVNLQDCGGRYEGNKVFGNKRGAVSVSASFDLDVDLLGVRNSLKGAMLTS